MVITPLVGIPSCKGCQKIWEHGECFGNGGSKVKGKVKPFVCVCTCIVGIVQTTSICNSTSTGDILHCVWGADRTRWTQPTWVYAATDETLGSHGTQQSHSRSAQGNRVGCGRVGSLGSDWVNSWYMIVIGLPLEKQTGDQVSSTWAFSPLGHNTWWDAFMDGMYSKEDAGH